MIFSNFFRKGREETESTTEVPEYESLEIYEPIIDEYIENAEELDFNIDVYKVSIHSPGI